MQDLQGFYAALAVLASALGCGLLMGIERERRKGRGPHRALAGVRSFTLVSLAGAVAALSGSVVLLGVGAVDPIVQGVQPALDELERALPVPARLVGINNRNLKTFEVSLDTTLALMGMVGPDRIVVTESGIHTRDDVLRMREAGVHAFLVGEAFMRADDPGQALAALFQ